MSHIADVAKGAELKHVETVDKSVPAIPADVVVKKVRFRFRGFVCFCFCFCFLLKFGQANKPNKPNKQKQKPLTLMRFFRTFTG